MKSIGLQPSSTGMVGGKETGQRMLDYVLPDAPFSSAFAELAAGGWRLNLQSTPRSGAAIRHAAKQLDELALHRARGGILE
jgi:hypothetical protein